MRFSNRVPLEETYQTTRNMNVRLLMQTEGRFHEIAVGIWESGESVRLITCPGLQAG
jgi:hypothetical protein